MQPPLPLSLVPLQHKQSQLSPLPFSQDAQQGLDLLSGLLGLVHAASLAWWVMGVCQINLNAT